MQRTWTFSRTRKHLLFLKIREHSMNTCHGGINWYQWILPWQCRLISMDTAMAVSININGYWRGFIPPWRCRLISIDTAIAVSIDITKAVSIDINGYCNGCVNWYQWILQWLCRLISPRRCRLISMDTAMAVLIDTTMAVSIDIDWHCQSLWWVFCYFAPMKVQGQRKQT